MLAALRSVLCLAALAAAQPIAAAPLTFGTIDGTADLSASPELGACADRGDDRLCRLNRSTFGGVPIDRGEVLLGSDGRARGVSIYLDREDYELARQLLAGRYGDPRPGAGGYRWAGYDDGANITLQRSGSGTLVRFAFPAPAAARAGTLPATAWTLLLFLALGLIAGLLIQRSRRRRAPPRLTATPTAPSSMRATLERRVREGRDLSF